MCGHFEHRRESPVSQIPGLVIKQQTISNEPRPAQWIDAKLSPDLSQAIQLRVVAGLLALQDARAAVGTASTTEGAGR